MTRTHVAALLLFAAAIPAATAASFFTSSDKPCFIAGSTGYRVSDSDAANVTVRIDNAAVTPDLRLQLIDDAAAADFVLVDDGDSGSACTGATAMQSVRIDPNARQRRPHGGVVTDARQLQNLCALGRVSRRRMPPRCSRRSGATAARPPVPAANSPPATDPSLIA